MQATEMDFDTSHATSMTPQPGVPSPGRSTTASDPEAFVRRFQAGIWRFLRLLGAQPSDAEDLTQETFLRFLAGHEPSAEAAPLLRTIARGLWVDQQRWHRRRRARDHAARVEELVAATTPELTDDRWLHALATCRETLADRARMALDLFYRDQLGRAAVATELGMTPNGTRTLLARTRHTLKACIEQRLDAEGDR